MTEAKNLAVEMIALERIKPSPTQPRKHFDAEAHAELTESMRQHGFTLSALLVRPEKCGMLNGECGMEGTFEIVAGERRWRAAAAAGINEVPCFVRELSDQQTLEMQLIENIQREDLTPIEEAEGYRQILSLRNDKGEPVYSLESLAQRIGRSERTIRMRVRLCDLNEEARREIEAGRFSPTVALLLVAIPDVEARNLATRKVLHPQHEIGPLSFRKTEELIHREFIRDLRAASFDQADAELLPMEYEYGDRTFDLRGHISDSDVAAIKSGSAMRTAGGACLDCPFKAGVGMLDKISSKKHNVCLKPSCFERKEERMWLRWQERETDEARKRRAADQAECLRLYPKGNQLNPGLGMVDLDEYPDGSDLRAGEDSPSPWRALIAGAELDVTVARDGFGKRHELVDRSKAIEAATTINRHAIFKATRQEHEPEHQRDARRKGEEKAKSADREANKRVLFACVDAVKVNAVIRGHLSTQPMAGLLRLLIDREIEISKAHPDFCKRHHLPIGGSVAKQLARRTPRELVAMLVEYVVSEGGFLYGDEVPEAQRAWLKVFGVDYRKAAKVKS